MKLRTKDEIITCLIQILSNPVPVEQRDYLIDEGWIEALKWALQLNDKEVFTEGKNTLVVKNEQKDVDTNS
tara:strand:- start:221 stop:433 length:213 start_codon:yes stop_codon:yes gene_type:complete